LPTSYFVKEDHNIHFERISVGVSIGIGVDVLIGVGIRVFGAGTVGIKAFV